MMKRFVLVMTYCSVGRSGEVGVATWNTAHWDEDQENLCMDWSELKTNQQKPMIYFSDALSYHIDFYHAAATYFITGGGKQYLGSCGGNINENWVFPNLAHLNNGAAGTVSKYLKDLVAHNIEGLFEGVSGTDLRVGSANAIVNHPNAELVHAIMRGGWEMSSINSMFEYVLQCPQSVAIAGRALAGWPNCRQKCVPPRLLRDTLTIDNFLFNLFDVTFNFTTPRSTMKSFMKTMLASILCYLDVILSTYPRLLDDSNSWLHIFLTKGKQFSFDLNHLKLWGAEIKDEWLFRNAKQLKFSNDCNGIDGLFRTQHLQMVELTSKCQQISCEVHSLATVVENQSKDIKLLTSSLQAVLLQLQQSSVSNSAFAVAAMDISSIQQDSIFNSNVVNNDNFDDDDIGNNNNNISSSQAVIPQSSWSFLKPQSNVSVSPFFNYNKLDTEILSHIIIAYYEHNWGKGTAAMIGADRKIRSNVLKVMEYIQTLATPQQLLVLEATSPGSISPDYLSWETSRRNVAEILQSLTMRTILEREKTVGLKTKSPVTYKATLSAVSKRLSGLANLNTKK